MRLFRPFWPVGRMEYTCLNWIPRKARVDEFAVIFVGLLSSDCLFVGIEAKLGIAVENGDVGASHQATGDGAGGN